MKGTSQSFPQSEQTTLVISLGPLLPKFLEPSRGPPNLLLSIDVAHADRSAYYNGRKRRLILLFEHTSGPRHNRAVQNNHMNRVNNQPGFDLPCNLLNLLFQKPSDSGIPVPDSLHQFGRHSFQIPSGLSGPARHEYSDYVDEGASHPLIPVRTVALTRESP